MSDMEDYLGKQIADAYKPDPTFNKLNNSALKNSNAEQQNALNQKSSYVIDLENKVKKLQKDLAEANKKADIYKDQISDASKVDSYYENLLAKPLSEIAEVNGNFGVNYQKIMLTVAEWMLSQKAFKATAIEIGAALGKSVDEIIQMGNAKKMDVLDDKFDPEHGCNANAIPLIEENREKLRATISTKKKIKP